MAPHERLPEILVVPREKTPTGVPPWLAFLGNISQILLLEVPSHGPLLLFLSRVFCAAAGPGRALSSLQKGAASALDRSCIGLLVPLALKPLEATLISL